MKPLTKLIVVDDDSDILKIVEISLEMMKDVTIKYFTTGQEAIAEALIFNPDLLILDIVMPNMNGFDVIQTMKLLPALSKIPVIFLTAKIQKVEIEECHKAGVKYIITKPFDPINLPNIILDMWSKINTEQRNGLFYSD